jgi:hypothetical protein
MQDAKLQIRILSPLVRGKAEGGKFLLLLGIIRNGLEGF